MNGVAALLKVVPESSLPLLPPEDTAKSRPPSMNQELGSH